MSAPIAAPLRSCSVPAHGLTFTARHSRGTTVRTRCQAVAARLSAHGWAVQIDSRPEGRAEPCRHCHGEHR